MNEIDIIGPGLWHVIHMLSLNATTDITKESFILTINTLCNNFGCDSCKPHFRQFIDDHPFKNYWHIQYKKEGDYGFFKWSWELHNSVNKRLKKQHVSFEDALFKYKNYICKDCDKDKKNQILVKINPVRDGLSAPDETHKLNLISYY